MRIFVLRLGERGDESGDPEVRLLSEPLSVEKTAAEAAAMELSEFERQSNGSLL